MYTLTLSLGSLCEEYSPILQSYSPTALQPYPYSPTALQSYSPILQPYSLNYSPGVRATMYALMLGLAPVGT